MDGADLSEGLSEWEQIQSPTLQVPPPAAQSSVTKWDDMVVIKDNYLHQYDTSIFPPTHHEGLQISSPDAQAQPSQQPYSNPSSSSSAEVDEERQRQSKSMLANEIGKCLRLRFEVLSSRVFWVATRVRNYAVRGGGFWSLASVSGVVAAMSLSLLYVRARRWRLKVREANKNRLILLIRKKDEKISQLLLQIAQMNEVLSARHRVPVLRVG